MPLTAVELAARAERLYINDAGFHARVQRAALVVEADRYLTDRERAAARQGAAVALVLVEVDAT